MDRKNIGKSSWGILGLVFTAWNLLWGNSNQQRASVITTNYPEENTKIAQPVYAPIELVSKAFDFSGIPEARVVYVRGFDSSLVTQTSMGVGVMPLTVGIVNTEDGLI